MKIVASQERVFLKEEEEQKEVFIASDIFNRYCQKVGVCDALNEEGSSCQSEDI